MDRLKGLFHDLADRDNQVERILQQPATYDHVLDAAAADTTASMPFYYAEEDMTVVEAKWLPNAVLTAHDTNYATITLQKAASGGSKTTLHQFTTKITGGSGNWAANTAIAMALVAGTENLDADEHLMVDIAKAGSGVAVPRSTCVVHLKPRP
jgi:hypothetical protein